MDTITLQRARKRQSDLSFDNARLSSMFESEVSSMASEIEAEFQRYGNYVISTKRSDPFSSFISNINLSSVWQSVANRIGRQFNTVIPRRNLIVPFNEKKLEVLVDDYRDGEIDKRQFNQLVADLIRSTYWLSIERAFTIARTEVHSIMVEAMFGDFAGKGYTKLRWVSVRDKASRHGPLPKPDHYSMHNKTVKLGTLFRLPTGLDCRFPGDPHLPASELVNCRCRIVGVR